jgi:hypothetical protein
MANYSGTVTGKNRVFIDAIDALHTNTQLGELYGTALRNALMEGAKAIDGFSGKADRTLTGAWTLFTGANPSMSASVTT